jgi:GxxExxY protein
VEFEDSAFTQIIIGCAMKVHTSLGNGFPEVIYQRALEIELAKTNLEFIREYEMPIHYDGQKIGSRRVDFLVQKRICVELKATIRLEDAHLAQSKNYLEAYNLKSGLLINFGGPRLEFKRLFNNRIK